MDLGSQPSTTFLAQVQTVVSTKKTWKLIKTQTWFAFRHLQKELPSNINIAWQEIQGTGHRGKIMKKDVLALLPENIENDTIKSPAQIEKVEEVPDNVTPYGEIERIPMTAMRKVIAQRMVESYLTAPTFTLNYEVDMTEMLALRKKVLEPIMEQLVRKSRLQTFFHSLL